MGGSKRREAGEPPTKRIKVTFRNPGGSAQDADAAAAVVAKREEETQQIPAAAEVMEIMDDDDLLEVKDDAYVFLDLELKPDHKNRPVWVTPDRRIFLESFSPLYRQAYDFLIAIAEPVSRPQCIHEYILTAHSLYAAVSVGLNAETIVRVLDKLSKVRVSKTLSDFVQVSTQNCGKLKLVIQDNKFLLESPYPEVLRKLLKDEVIAKAVKDKALLGRILEAEDAHHHGGGEETAGKATDTGGFIVKKDVGTGQVARELTTINLIEDEDDEGGEKNETRGRAPGEGVATTAAAGPLSEELIPTREGGGDEAQAGFPHAVEILPAMIEHVKKRCLPGNAGLNYPILEEYDFQNDKKNPDLVMDLKPTALLRSYQQKSLSKMFSNGRAR